VTLDVPRKIPYRLSTFHKQEETLMAAFALFGFRTSPMSRAGKWIRLAVIHGESIDEAAAKVGAKVTSKDGHVREGRRFCGIVSRTIVASKRLSGKKRRAAITETRRDIQTLEQFRLEPIPGLS
jgi:hypothetical protein